MGKIQVLGLVASAATLLCGGNAFAQQVVGGMGEPVQIGTFGTHAESPFARRSPAGKPSAKAHRARGAEVSGAQARQAVPTLPGRHLR